MSTTAWRRVGIAYGAVPVGLFGSVIAIAVTVSVHPPDKPAAG